MSCIGTCGHEFTEDDGLDGLGTIMRFKENDRITSYPVVCNECVWLYLSWGAEIHSGEEYE
jgi:hypothetical protein